MFFVMGRRETLKGRVCASKVALIAALVGSLVAGCAVEEAEDSAYVPRVPQVTHPLQVLEDGNAIDDDVDPEVAEDLADGGSELEPPEVPDEIYENTLEGAEAAARYYFRALEYGFASHDTEPLEFICHDKSKTCATHIESVKILERKG